MFPKNWKTFSPTNYLLAVNIRKRFGENTSSTFYPFQLHLLCITFMLGTIRNILLETLVKIFQFSPLLLKIKAIRNVLSSHSIYLIFEKNFLLSQMKFFFSLQSILVSILSIMSEVGEIRLIVVGSILNESS